MLTLKGTVHPEIKIQSISSHPLELRSKTAVQHSPTAEVDGDLFWNVNNTKGLRTACPV